MKDIEINTGFRKFLYWFSWIGFVLSMSVLTWGTALVLARFGKNNYKNTKMKAGVLNQTWQKFVYFSGIILACWFLFIAILFTFF